jgi:hypothetical protein
VRGSGDVLWWPLTNVRGSGDVLWWPLTDVRGSGKNSNYGVMKCILTQTTILTMKKMT